MINGVGSTSPTRIGQIKDEKVAGTAPAETVTKADEKAVAMTFTAALAEAGPPINDEKIKAIRQAIANGQYPLDPKAIAKKMIALDLPKANA